MIQAATPDVDHFDPRSLDEEARMGDAATATRRPTAGTTLRRALVLRPERNLQLAIAIVAIALFVTPVIAVVIGSFRTSPFTEGPAAGIWSSAPFVDVLTSASTWSTLWNTVLLTVASVVPGILLAILFCTLVTRTNAWAKWLITGTMAILVATPPMFYALTWTMLANTTSGLLNVFLRGISAGFEAGTFEYGDGPFDINSWGGLIAVSLFRATGFMFLLLVGPFGSMDRTLEEAARVSGAGPIRTFFGTQIPTLIPAITAVFIGAAVSSMEAFDVPILIGNPAGIYVLPTEVYNYIYAADKPMYGHAMAVSIILLVILLGLLVAERKVQGRRRFTTVSGKGARQVGWALGPWRPVALAATVIFSLIAVILPFLQLLLVSFSPYMGWNNWGAMFDPSMGLTLRWYEEILGNPATVATYVRTAVYAAGAAFLAVCAVIVVLWSAQLRRGKLATILQASQLMPLVVPGLLLALGIIVIILMGPGRVLYGSALLLVLGLFITVVPLGNRSLAGAIVQIPAELEEAVRVSGGTRARALVSVVVRLLLPSALNGWLLAFIVASGTLAMPMVLGDSNAPMLAVKVYTDTVTNANFTLAAAEFVLFILEILAIAAVIQLISWSIRRSTTRTGPQRRLGAPADPDWTGAVIAPAGRRVRLRGRR